MKAQTDLGKVCYTEVLDYLDANKLKVWETVIWTGKEDGDIAHITAWSVDNVALIKNGTDVGDDTAIDEDDNMKVEWLVVWWDVWESAWTCWTQSAVGVEVIAAIPLKIIKFEGRYNKEMEVMVIELTSVNRINVEYIDLEVSRDGAYFESIEDVYFDSPNNYSEEIIKFEVSIKDIKKILGDPKVGKPYYFRMRINDLDGAFDYSSVISIMIGNEEYVNLYSNPIKDNINIISSKETVLKVYNQMGICVRKLMVRSGENIIDLSYLSKGIYILRSKEGLINKIVKQ